MGPRVGGDLQADPLQHSIAGFLVGIVQVRIEGEDRGEVFPGGLADEHRIALHAPSSAPAEIIFALLPAREPPLDVQELSPATTLLDNLFTAL